MNCSLGAATGMALFAMAALAQEQQPTTDLDKIIGIAIASIPRSRRGSQRAMRSRSGIARSTC
jgi:hypothetical protein